MYLVVTILGNHFCVKCKAKSARAKRQHHLSMMPQKCFLCDAGQAI